MTARSDDYKDTVLHMVGRGRLPPGVIAVDAARLGYLDLVRDMIDRGADDFDRIGRAAAEGDHLHIIDYLSNIFPYLDYRYLAAGALSNGYNDLHDYLMSKTETVGDDPYSSAPYL